jgi:hypothetical protein
MDLRDLPIEAPRNFFRWGTRSTLAKEVSLEGSFLLAVELLSPLQWNKICTGSGGKVTALLLIIL